MAVPWVAHTDEVIDLPQTKATLDADHSGIEKIKDRILEYLAVRKLKPDVKGPILLLRRTARRGQDVTGALDRERDRRKFVRVSLGGMRDEARSAGIAAIYIGALPGQIIQGLRRAGVKNPVFILDEIDKLGSDFRGDPASALLEVLDPEQNTEFRDHYLDVPFNLSEVLFITTANVLDTIPPPLRDRMEVIELAGYTEREKLAIAKTIWWPRQVTNHGLSPETITFEDEALIAVIRGYTREAGVRNLEREIGSICRKIARRHAEGDTTPITITAEMGRRCSAYRVTCRKRSQDRTKEPGVAIGLAWTPVGGDVLLIEASRMAGGSSLTLTGSLGDVMKESARIALSWAQGARTYTTRSTRSSTRTLRSTCTCRRAPSQGRTVGGCDDGGGAGLDPVRPACARGHGDDGRGHSVGQSAAGGRDQREGAGRAAVRHPSGDCSETERDERPGRPD